MRADRDGPPPLSQQPVQPSGGALLRNLIIATVILIGVYMLAAHLYRQSHCVLILGHWVSVYSTTIPLFCQ